MRARTVNIAEYLYIRLRQLGCTSLHGLPGDFNLVSLDYIKPCGLRWVGNCNELNAGYAADGYARVTGMGALMTTFGVGELSAVNAIAGSFAEIVPVVHIVGTPARPAQQKRLPLHHTLGNGDFQIFARMHSEITIAQANLVEPETAPAEIDRVLRACYVDSRPVYIQLPVDMVTKPVDASLLEKPIDVTPWSSDAGAEAAVLQLITQRLYAAKKPAILVDGAVTKRRITKQVDALIRKLGIPVFTTPMGKGAVDETLPNFCGTYVGQFSRSDVKYALESSDLVITIGGIKSDLNSAVFTYGIRDLDTVDLNYDQCTVGYGKFEKVYFKSLIPRLETALNPAKLNAGAQDIPSLSHKQPAEGLVEYGHDVITHSWLWPRIADWLKDDDIIVTDTGSSFMGYWESRMPRNTLVINQILWSSIGYGVGAAQGASLAAKEDGNMRRTVCFEGDGSFQLTAQELSTMIRLDLNVTMFLIENEGYTIERVIHGLEEEYNDIAEWKYSKLPDVFTPESKRHRVKTWNIHSRHELEKLLQDDDFANGSGLQFVELHMPKLDAPELLKQFAAMIAK